MGEAVPLCSLHPHSVHLPHKPHSICVSLGLTRGTVCLSSKLLCKAETMGRTHVFSSAVLLAHFTAGEERKVTPNSKYDCAAVFLWQGLVGSLWPFCCVGTAVFLTELGMGRSAQYLSSCSWFPVPMHEQSPQSPPRPVVLHSLPLVKRHECLLPLHPQPPRDGWAAAASQGTGI